MEVKGDTNDEVKSGDDGLGQPSSKLNWIQKILSSARMGGISGPLVSVYHQNVDTHLAYCHCADTNGLLLLNVTFLTQLIQSSIIFDDGASTNKGGGVDSDASNSGSNLVSPSSRAVIVRDEDPGLSIHSTAENESASVSKPEVSKDVSLGPNLSLKLNADDGDDDGQEVDPNLENTTVDVSTLSTLSPCCYSFVTISYPFAS